MTYLVEVVVTSPDGVDARSFRISDAPNAFDAWLSILREKYGVVPDSTTSRGRNPLQLASWCWHDADADWRGYTGAVSW